MGTPEEFHHLTLYPSQLLPKCNFSSDTRKLTEWLLLLVELERALERSEPRANEYGHVRLRKAGEFGHRRRRYDGSFRCRTLIFPSNTAETAALAAERAQSLAAALVIPLMRSPV